MEDSRFARVSEDPRFKKIPCKEKKLKIDGRFQKMFTDKEFTTKYFVDKRGSKVKKTSTEDLHKFYELSAESDEESLAEEEGKEEKTVKDIKETKSKKKTKKELQESKDEVKVGSSDKDVLKANKTKSNDRQDDESEAEEEEEEEGEEEEEEEEEEDFARGEGNVESSSDEESEESISLEIQREEIEHPWGEIDVSAKMTKDATKRLALCNIDWDRVKATDLYVLFSSVKPRDGIIQSIKIYPSEYGLEQMRKEECIGPVELREDDNEGVQKTTSSKEGPGFSMEKLRQYQLNRLKYFYAVIECDRPETADILYEECDGMEFEHSGNALDLRFIPDDMEFEHEPHSIATELPASDSYTVPEFNTTALRQTNVKLTWDETDPRRQRAMMRKFKKEDLYEMDFNAYLASSSDEDELEEKGQDDNDSSSEDEDKTMDKKMDKYKLLLKEIHDKEKKAERDEEMEITWEPGLEETRGELVTRRIQEKEEKTMTPWEKYLQARKEKRKDKRRAKHASKKQLPGNTADDSDEIPSDVDLSDPFCSGSTGMEKRAEEEMKSIKSKKKGKHTDTETIEDKKTKDELELLVMDDKDDRQHFSLKAIMENEKKSKKKRKRKLKDSDAVEDNFTVDLQDSRFDALFTSHHYAVDPSDPRFRKTKAMEAIINERLKRREETERSKNRADEKGSQSLTSDPSSLHSLSLLVKSVKSKTGQFHELKKIKSKH